MIMHPRITIIEITQQNTFLVINARTGILKPSLRTISIASVPTREFLKQGCTKGCNKLGLGSKSRGILMS